MLYIAHWNKKIFICFDRDTLKQFYEHTKKNELLEEAKKLGVDLTNDENVKKYSETIVEAIFKKSKNNNDEQELF